MCRNEKSGLLQTGLIRILHNILIILQNEQKTAELSENL